jgi:flagellar L-ring protein precursor FlgH
MSEVQMPFFRTKLQCRPCRVVIFMLAAGALSGCNALTRLAEVGREPPMTTIQNPVAAPNYRPVSMPMPRTSERPRAPNSLWRHGARAFFKDQRAARVGDLLTVMITMDDSATLNNTSTRSRANTETAGASSLLGFESQLSKILPNAVSPGSLLDLSSDTSNSGTGAITRDEEINLKIAAVITQRLPNGNLVLAGRQEVRVNFEVRQLQVAGVVRPEDIKADNTISSDKIAEARISYGGKGHISDIQQPRYGTQILDVIFPF